MAVIKGDGHDERERSAAAQRAGEQGLLFDDDLLPAGPQDGRGYRGPTACTAAGITYRQLDYWARTGLVEPSVTRGHGLRLAAALRLPRHPRAAVVKRLLDTGISLQQIRAAVTHLREHGATDLAQITLMSDGASVYACTSPGRSSRPAPGRPGRIRDRARPGLAGGRGLARRPACRAPGRRRATMPGGRTPQRTSSPGAARAEPASRPPSVRACAFRRHAVISC